MLPPSSLVRQPGFDAILFDFDGVLMDSEPVHFACWRDVLSPLGVPLDWDYYREHCIGVEDKLVMRQLAGETHDWHDLWAQYPAKKECFRRRLAATPPFAPGLERLLQDLAGRFRMAIVSSSALTEIQPLVERAGLSRYFETIVGGECVQHHKPAPEPYLLAASRLRVRAPLVIEDSAPGVASGRAAGFEVLQVRHPNELDEVLRRRLFEPTDRAQAAVSEGIDPRS